VLFQTVHIHKRDLTISISAGYHWMGHRQFTIKLEEKAATQKQKEMYLTIFQLLIVIVDLPTKIYG